MPDWLLIVLTVLWLLGSAWCGLTYGGYYMADAWDDVGPLLHTVSGVTVLGVPLLLGWAALANGVHAWPAALYLVPHGVAAVVLALVAYGFVWSMMNAKNKIREGTRQFLEDGEEVLAAFAARPREPRRRYGFEAAGFTVKDWMALACTQRRILSLELGWADGGAVIGLLAAVPLGDVDAVKARRLLVGRVVTLTVRGEDFTFDVGTRTNIRFDVGAGTNIRKVQKALKRARA